MKKTLMVIGILLVMVLLLGGCAPRNVETTQTTEKTEAEENVIDEISEPADEQASEAADSVVDEEIAEPEPEAAPDAGTPAAAKPDISREELDELKKDIEGIETDDLGGLAEE